MFDFRRQSFHPTPELGILPDQGRQMAQEHFSKKGMITEVRPALEIAEEFCIVIVNLLTDRVADVRVEELPVPFPVPSEDQVGLFLRSLFKDGQDVLNVASL